MLNEMGLVELLCRVIAKETKREFREEAIQVSIALLLGGNHNSQNSFYRYICSDSENEFCL